MEIKTENGKKWNINLDSERNFWNEKLKDKFIKIPKNCPLCMKPYINKIPNSTLNNPILGKCTKFEKAIYLRENIIFGLFPSAQASKFFIINLWLLEEKNLNKIFNYMKNNTSININNQQFL